MSEDFESRLRDHGYRLTPQRRQVWETVERLRHATPDQIVAEVPALARQELGDADFGQAWAEGQSLSLDEAIAEALEKGPAEAPAHTNPVAADQ